MKAIKLILLLLLVNSSLSIAQQFTFLKATPQIDTALHTNKGLGYVAMGNGGHLYFRDNYGWKRMDGGSGGSYTFENGLVDDGGTVKWNAPLTESTTINLSGFDLTFNNPGGDFLQIADDGTLYFSDAAVFGNVTNLSLGNGSSSLIVSDGGSQNSAIENQYYSISATVNSNTNAQGKIFLEPSLSSWFVTNYSSDSSYIRFRSEKPGDNVLLKASNATSRAQIKLNPEDAEGAVAVDLQAGTTDVYIRENEIEVSGVGAFAGIRYGTDYSANFVSNSLTNKTYVDDHFTGLTFTNSPSNGNVPTYNGTNWTFSTPGGGGMTNPMTTGGDIIYGGASGTPTRLANGSAGQFLRSAGGTSSPTWGDPISGLTTNYLTKAASATTINNSSLYETSNTIGLGTTSPDRKFHVEVDDATTNAITYPLRITHTTSGTPATSIATGLEFETETSAGNNEVGATIENYVTSTSLGSESFGLRHYLMTAGSLVNAMALTSGGDNLTIGEGTATVNKTISSGGTGSDHNLNLTGKGTGFAALKSADGTNSISVSNTALVVETTGSGDESDLSSVTRNAATYRGSSTGMVYPLRVRNYTSGSKAVGIGAGIEFMSYTAGSNLEIGATVEAESTDVTNLTEDFDLVFKTMSDGAAATEKFRIVSKAASLTDGAAITITTTKHTLSTNQATITFTDSYVGDQVLIEVTFNTTSSTWTFPSGALCVFNGTPSGDNTMEPFGASGDKILVYREKIGSNYYYTGVNMGQ